MVRKIYLACLLLLSMVFASSCSDDDVYDGGSKLSVASANVEFTSDGGSGIIVVRHYEGTVSATADAPWVTIGMVNDSTVSVTVSPYTEYANRSAVITLSDGIGETHVAVLQQGGIWSVSKTKFIVNNNSNSVIIPVKTNLEYNAELPDWIEGTKTEDGYFLTIQANSTGVPRSGNVTLKTSREETVVQILQFNPSQLEGIYTASFQNYDWDWEYGSDQTKEVVVKSEDDGTFLVSGLSADSTMSYRMHFDEQDGVMYFASDEFIGTRNIDGATEYCYSKLYSTNNHSVTTRNSLHYIAPIEMVDGHISLSFTDNIGFTYRSFYGAETGYIDGIAIYRFASKTVDTTSDDALGYLEVLMNVKMVSK